MDFGKRLKQFAVTAYDEIRVFAAAMEVSPSTVSMWFGMKKIPGGESLEKIYNAGCSIDWLISGKGNMLVENEAGLKIKERLNFPNEDEEEIKSMTYEKMLKFPFFKDLRVLIREDFKEAMRSIESEKKNN